MRTSDNCSLLRLLEGGASLPAVPTPSPPLPLKTTIWRTCSGQVSTQAGCRRRAAWWRRGRGSLGAHRLRADLSAASGAQSRRDLPRDCPPVPGSRLGSPCGLELASVLHQDMRGLQLRARDDGWHTVQATGAPAHIQSGPWACARKAALALPRRSAGRHRGRHARADKLRLLPRDAAPRGRHRRRRRRAAPQVPNEWEGSNSARAQIGVEPAAHAFGPRLVAAWSTFAPSTRRPRCTRSQARRPSGAPASARGWRRFPLRSAGGTPGGARSVSGPRLRRGRRGSACWVKNS